MTYEAVNSISTERSYDTADEAERVACAVRALVAKTAPDDAQLWLPLLIHLRDTAAVMEYLTARWLPEQYCVSLGLQREEFFRLAIRAALLHDIGKATPNFQRKITLEQPELRQRLEAVGLEIRFQKGKQLDVNVPHAAAGAEILRSEGFTDDLAAVVGAHHGRTEEYMLTSYCEKTPIAFGWSGSGDSDTLWGSVQRHIIRWAEDELGCGSPARDAPCSVPVQMALSGLVIMADWIASNTAYFPLISMDAQPDRYDPRRADRALQKLDLPRPWQVSADWSTADYFQRRFGFSANLVQQQMEQVAGTVKTPGVMILEAPMGHGKTEAALAAAEILMNRFGLGGAAFFLPSQATSNAMFTRMTQWARHQPDAVRVAVELAHGQAELNAEFACLESGHVHIEQGEADADPLQTHAFFRGRKTKLLANLVVGTVDQLLMAALNRKHVMLRQLGLTGKVVILDECHAYDAYMNTYLDRVLNWLGAYHVPVVLLSATLPGQRRAELLRAYLGEKKPVDTAIAACQDYPLLSWTENKTVHMAAVSAQGCSRDVCVQRVEEEQALAAAGEALKSGCVGLIVNTVKRAQMLREELRQAYPDAVILMDHSRFLAPDRLEHEQEILRRVGKNTDAQMRRGVLVIGTQVLEQSLDLDFDLLITDLCPMDLLLQRIGRLHRHTRIRPQGLEVPRCLVMGALGELDAGSKAVYGEYLLLRTRRLLPEHIRLPEDISPLVQRTYDAVRFPPESDEETGAAYEAYQYAQKRQKRKAEVYLLAQCDVYDSLVGMMDDIDQFTDLQAQAAVRGGTAAVEVLVVQRSEDGMLLLSGEQKVMCLRADTQPSADEARWVAAQRLRLPSYFGARYCVDAVLKALEDQTHQSLPLWLQTPMLEGELFLILDADGTAQLAGKTLRYDPQVGLTEEEETHGTNGIQSAG